MTAQALRERQEVEGTYTVTSFIGTLQHILLKQTAEKLSWCSIKNDSLKKYGSWGYSDGIFNLGTRWK
jgi:hypothetical protein